MLRLDPTTGALPSVVDLFMTSPIINGLLLGLSVLAVGLFLYLLLTINGRAMVPSDFIDEVTKLVLRGRYEQAADLCRRSRRVFAASVVQRACENADKAQPVVLEMIDQEGTRRAEIVWNRVSYLADISNVAPMLGLLGTVIGMMKAFFVADFVRMDATSGALTSGIAQAMVTTFAGLTVGIAALVFYSIIKSRATRTLAEAEAAVYSIADHVHRAEGVRGPGTGDRGDGADAGAVEGERLAPRRRASD